MTLPVSLPPREANMKVKVKKMQVDMEVKNNGIEFQVNDNKGSLRGDLYVTKTGLIWCEGKTPRKNGKTISWNDFIDWANEG
jgi:hypothetical protein